jgi:hypothetical protein
MLVTKINYKFGTKNNWRRITWNRIIERLHVPARDAVVVYLAGESDLDRQEAKRRGFRDNNLIPVERDKNVCKKLRDKKILCVHGDIIQALDGWPIDRRVDVVLCDLVSGLEDKYIHAMNRWMNYREAFSTTVFCFNFQRGREHNGKAIKSIVSGRGGCSESDAEIFNKHRGMFFYVAAFHNFCFAQGVRCNSTGRVLDQKSFPDVEEFFRNASAPWFEHYYSTAGNLVFDSVVMRNPYQFLMKNQKFNEIEERKYCKDSKTKKSVSAILAHRTRRSTQ